MTTALLLTGNTYPLKAVIRSTFYPYKFDKLRGGWLIPMDRESRLRPFADEHDLMIEVVPLELQGDAKREAVQELREKKLPALHTRLARLQAAYNERRDKYSSYTSDYSFITQPILIGHHSEGRHRKLRERIANNECKKMELYDEIQQVKAQIERMENIDTIQVKGDAATRRAAKMDAIDKLVGVGSRIFSHIYGKGTIKKVNKITYIVDFDRGHTIKVEKHFCYALNNE